MREVDRYLTSSAVTSVFAVSHEYVDEATRSNVVVYVSRPPALGKYNARLDAEFTVTLTVNKSARTVCLAPANAAQSFQNIGRELFEILNPDTMHANWMHHNYISLLRLKEAEHGATVARLEKRINELQAQVRSVSDEHNAWVVQQQISSGMDPSAYAHGSNKHESYMDMIEGAEESALLETDLQSDDHHDEGDRAKKRMRVDDEKKDKKE